MGPLPDGRGSVLKPPGSGISLGVVTGLEAPVLGGRDWVGRRTIERGLLMGPLPDGRGSVLKPPGTGISVGVVPGLEAPVLRRRDWVGRRTIERGLLMGPLPDGRDSVLLALYAVRTSLRRWYRLTPNRDLLNDLA